MYYKHYTILISYSVISLCINFFILLCVLIYSGIENEPTFFFFGWENSKKEYEPTSLETLKGKS